MATATNPAPVKAATSTTSAPLLAAPPGTPGTSLEARIAKLALERDPAGSEAQAALDWHLESLESRGSTFLWPWEMLRKYWDDWILLSARVDLVKRLVAGGPAPDWPEVLAAAKEAVATELIRRATARHSGTVNLVEHIHTWVGDDTNELEQLRGDHRAGDGPGAFHPHGRKMYERIAALEDRTARRTKALAAFQPQFAQRLKAVVAANRAALERGLQEAALLDGQHPLPSQIAEAERDLERINDKLVTLGLAAASTIEAGPVGTALKAQAAEITKRLDGLRRGHGADIGAIAKAKVEAATDLYGWATLCDAVVRGGQSFPDELLPKLWAVGTDAILASGDVATWDSVVRATSNQNSPGRECE